MPTAGGRLAGRVRERRVAARRPTLEAKAYFFVSSFKRSEGKHCFQATLVLFGFWSPELFLGPTTVRPLLLWLSKAHRWSFPGADPGLCTSRGGSRGVYTLRRWKGLGKKETLGRE